MQKYSRQREAIRMYLMSTDRHPTAETVYNNIKEDIPNISLGTVYRNLKLLCDNNEIMRIDCGDNTEHFDANTNPHNHLHCRKCLGLFDIHMDSIDHIKTIAAANYKGRIESYVTIFYGICEECCQKEL